MSEVRDLMDIIEWIEDNYHNPIHDNTPISDYLSKAKGTPINYNYISTSSDLSDKIGGKWIKTKINNKNEVTKLVYKFEDETGTYYTKVYPDKQLGENNIKNMIILNDIGIKVPDFHAEVYDDMVITIEKQAGKGYTLKEYFNKYFDKKNEFNPNIIKSLELLNNLISNFDNVKVNVNSDHGKNINNYLKKQIMPESNEFKHLIYSDCNLENFFVITDDKDNINEVMPIDFDYVDNCKIQLTYNYLSKHLWDYSPIINRCFTYNSVKNSKNLITRVIHMNSDKLVEKTNNELMIKIIKRKLNERDINVTPELDNLLECYQTYFDIKKYFGIFNDTYDAYIMEKHKQSMINKIFDALKNEVNTPVKLEETSYDELAITQ